MTSLLISELSLSSQKAEEWKAIPGYEGLYEASTMGRIRSAEGKTTSSARFPHRVWKQRIIKPKTEKRKGLKGLTDERVCLWKDGKEKTLLVSRLVAMTFCEFPFDQLTVNHINGDPMDNRPENLEWVTHGENIKHGFDTGLYNKNKKGVVLTDTKTDKQISFKSMSDADRFIGRCNGYISCCLANCRLATSKDNNQQYHIQLQ